MPTKSRTTLYQRKEIISHSPRCEDLLLFGILGDREDGFYVDVGAHASTKASVTKFFYDRGWQGINIEPLPEGYANLCVNRSRDININAACSSENGEMSFYVHGEQSTLDKTKALSINVITVKVLRLTDIIEEYAGDRKKTIHFCKIDVEGFEKDVLLGLDLEKIRPWIFCIENNRFEKNPPFLQWEHILNSGMYKFIGDDEQNRYYAASEHIPDLKSFEYAEKTLNEYDIWHTVSCFVPAVDTAYFKAYCIGAKLLKPIYGSVKRAITTIQLVFHGK